MTRLRLALTTRHRRNRAKARDYARDVERQEHRMVRAARDEAIRQRDEYAELVDALRGELAVTRRSLAEHADGMREQRETIDRIAAENQRLLSEHCPDCTCGSGFLHLPGCPYHDKARCHVCRQGES